MRINLKIADKHVPHAFPVLYDQVAAAWHPGIRSHNLHGLATRSL